MGTKFDPVLGEQQILSEQQILCKLALRSVLDEQQILQTGLPSLSPVTDFAAGEAQRVM